MPKNSALDTASATSTDEKRGRKPSDFSSVGTIVLSVHSASGATVLPESLAETIAQDYMSRGYAARVVHQTREGHRKDGTPIEPGNTYRVQIAPAGFEFPVSGASAGGARISPEAAAIVRQIASAAGVSFEEALMMGLKALAGKAE